MDEQLPYTFEREEPHMHWKPLAVVFALFVLCAFFIENLEVAGKHASAAPSVLAVTAEPMRYVPLVAAREQPEATSTRILFVGDMFFDRQIRFDASTQGGDYLFSCIDPLMQSADMVVGNLEGPITDNPSVSFGTIPGSAKNYVFTFPTTTPELLLRHNIRAVDIGNNHILNFGYDGLAQTHHYLTAEGLPFFGGVKGSEPVYRTEVNGVPFSFVSYNQFGGAASSSVAQTIRLEKAAGRVVVVFAHWGVEYDTSADTVRPVAELFAQSGAAAVIGAHPHVVGEHEEIGSTKVYYSLGNFIFDQYFDWSVMHGLAVMLTFDKTGVVHEEEYPTELERDGRTCLAK